MTVELAKMEDRKSFRLLKDKETINLVKTAINFNSWCKPERSWLLRQLCFFCFMIRGLGFIDVLEIIVNTAKEGRDNVEKEALLNSVAAMGMKEAKEMKEKQDIILQVIREQGRLTRQQAMAQAILMRRTSRRDGTITRGRMEQRAEELEGLAREIAEEVRSTNMLLEDYLTNPIQEEIEDEEEGVQEDEEEE